MIQRDMELWGVAELCEAMGVTKPGLAGWRKDPTFPAPAYELRMGPAWRAEQVRAWRRRKVKQRRDARAF
jgi:predicted DNA-binding transcriptional regulator AlpA